MDLASSAAWWAASSATRWAILRPPGGRLLRPPGGWLLRPPEVAPATSRGGSYERKPNWLESQPNTLESQPNRLERKPKKLESKPNMLESKTPKLERKPNRLESKPSCHYAVRRPGATMCPRAAKSKTHSDTALSQLSLHSQTVGGNNVPPRHQVRNPQ